VKSKIFLETLKASGVKEIYLSGSASPKPAKDEWSELKKEVLQCIRCPELVRNRNKIVFGSGNPKAKLVFVGEAPGAEEDRQGLPFVGRAGQLLTKMIEAIQLKREDVFIANVLKCRPPNNRPPQPQEIQNCEPYLVRQLELIHPKVICALGTFAAQTLLKTMQTISSLRGRVHNYKGIDLICTFHPAYLLRNPAEKKRAWEDLKKVRELVNA